MVLRVYALCGSIQWIWIFLSLCLCAQIVLQSVALVQGVREFTFCVSVHMAKYSLAALPATPVPGSCVLTSTAPFYSVYWIAPLAMDSIMFALTFWSWKTYFRQQTVNT
jgi:hypothetical protein